MKRKFLLLFILIAGLSSSRISAQPGNYKTEILQAVYRTSYEPAGVLTANTENILRFESNDTSVKRLLVNASNGSVKQKGKDFIVQPDKPGILVLTIYNNNDIDNPILIEQREMTVTTAPVATIAGKNGGKISMEELTRADIVECTGNYTVTEFKFSVAGKGIDYKEYQGLGENLTPKMISAVQLIPPGGKIYIEYIRAKPEGSEATRQISPLSFTVTE